MWWFCGLVTASDHSHQSRVAEWVQQCEQLWCTNVCINVYISVYTLGSEPRASCMAGTYLPYHWASSVVCESCVLFFLFLFFQYWRANPWSCLASILPLSYIPSPVFTLYFVIVSITLLGLASDFLWPRQACYLLKSVSWVARTTYRSWPSGVAHVLVTLVVGRLFQVSGGLSGILCVNLVSTEVVDLSICSFPGWFLLGGYLFGPLLGFLVLKLGIVLLSVRLLNNMLFLQVISWTVSLISLCLSFLRLRQPKVIHWWLNNRHFYLTAVKVQDGASQRFGTQWGSASGLANSAFWLSAKVVFVHWVHQG